jgi:hypothetical protein
MERVQAAQLVASFDTRFVVRWRPDVLPLGTVPGTRRIQYEGQSYDVQSVRELGRHEALEVEARASDAPAGALGRRAPGPG